MRRVDASQMRDCASRAIRSSAPRHAEGMDEERFDLIHRLTG
jgi:hypothetical protein